MFDLWGSSWVNFPACKKRAFPILRRVIVLRCVWHDYSMCSFFRKTSTHLGVKSPRWPSEGGPGRPTRSWAHWWSSALSHMDTNIPLLTVSKLPSRMKSCSVFIYVIPGVCRRVQRFFFNTRKVVRTWYCGVGYWFLTKFDNMST